ncbi:hypothetical protein BGZ54_010069 [Gamsiella multidivaricata]|nr:hypothetical protein BGZ54_010069 [Gamsiella multidivaricata]
MTNKVISSVTTQAGSTYRNDKDVVNEQQTGSSPIRCMGPYQVSGSIWLTQVWRSDALELYRVLNIDKSIYEGLYSSNMTFPYPKAGAVSFTERHERRRMEKGVATSWAIRTSIDGPIIGLIALDPFDHGDDIGPCFASNCTDIGRSRALNCGGLGYWVSSEHTGKGVMKQVLVYALERIAYDELGYERVHGEAWVENVGSRRVMEHAGMERTVGVPCFVPTKDTAHYIVDLPRERRET